MIRIGIVGTSSISERFAEAVDLVDGVVVSRVASRDADRARAFADAVGAPATATGVDDLLAADDVDAVYLASPNAVHAVQISAAVDAGIPTLVEKPAVLSAAEWDALVGHARERGVVLLEAMRTAYDPGLAAVGELLPRLGTVRRVSLRYEKRSARYDHVLAGEQTNIFDPALGGSALRDLGVYPLHALVRLFGAPRAIHAARVGIASGTDGLGSALAVYDGFVADIAWSKITDTALPSEIQGEDGSLAIDAIDAPRRLTLTPRSEAPHGIAVDAPDNPMVGEVERLREAVEGADISDDQDVTSTTLRLVDEMLATPLA
ncbi:Predicted dehydrogenase [Microbacterium sp. ru370.1]|uniref:Gfo/Idh/MocA family protein n=1 Tax=unclassified Microbacterium TaxID=2609290 RepID=UPI00087E2CA0|nr:MULTISPECIES: Gfo/Idh/MocA family oxidoreductase [unclassified Microbacterium]SDO41565.1 Predicted dehydrogenase [Microbacterium sp. ru370.1]SIT79926.1 Predicted dehydrogenase [Microbacterium sp. RU1D]